MNNFYLIIGILASASYLVGFTKMLTNQYTPSTFSRVIWVLLAINSFAGVLLSHSSPASLLLASILLLGNIALCIASFWKGTREFGALEYFCTFLLLLSIMIWIFFNSPTVNLLISLFAHFVAGCPTFKKVWIKPQSEDLVFWLLFAVASVISLFAGDFSSPQEIIFPIYFALFDGGMVLLILRKFRPAKLLSVNI